MRKDEFDKLSKERRGAIIQKAKRDYMGMFTAMMVSFGVLTLFSFVGMAIDVSVGLGLFGICFVVVLGIIMPIFIVKSTSISRLNRMMTIEEKVNYFGSQSKYHSFFKQYITFDTAMQFNVVFEDKSKNNKKKRICAYCGGEINEDDEDCPGCGSRQFEDK